MDYRPNADIFETGAEMIVNPVNCQAHLLKPGRQMGLAGAFEEKFPAIQEKFKNVCATGRMKPGFVQILGIDRSKGQLVNYNDADLFIANIATKDHWRDPSKLEWVDNGLRKLAGVVKDRNIKSIAIPKLGAGYGKLPWPQVRDLVEKHFGTLEEAGVQVMVLGEGPTLEKNRIQERERNRTTESKTEDTKFFAGIGARKTPEQVLKTMKDVAKILSKQGFVLRSGGADGADSAFEAGVDEVDSTKKEIFLPWDGFDPKRDGNKRYANGTTVFADEASPRHIDLARKYHPKFDEMGRGAQSLHARNGSQMFGRHLDHRTDVVVCYTERGEVKGGTGQALRIAGDAGIPIVNLGDDELRYASAEFIAKRVMNKAGIKLKAKEKSKIEIKDSAIEF